MKFELFREVALTGDFPEHRLRANTVHLAFDGRFLATDLTDSTDGRNKLSFECAHPLNPLNPWLKILGLSEQC
jgi:hypothetical protein